jgi:hypothetical protein
VYIAHNGIQVSFDAAATIDTSTRDHEYTAKNRRTPNAERRERRG